MKLGLQLGYWGAQPSPGFVELAQQVEGLGFDSVWTAEAYGSDAITPLAWVGAHTSRIKLGTAVLQLSARTPTAAAMTALTLDHLSGGRLILGIGVSGPQVVEGWYGQPFPRPLERTREWVEIFRKVLAREEPVSLQGRHYQLPFQGGTGKGKPLKSITHPLRKHVPLYLGAEGPKNVALSAEICDGWLPLFVSPFKFDIFEEAIKDRADDFEIAATVTCNIHDDVKQALMPVKMSMGFYLGGMGARDENFHKNLMDRLGYADATERIQDLFYDGKRAEAIAAVPDELADEISLCGPRERIRERLQAWKESPVTTLLVGNRDIETLRFLAEELL
ncbi:MAG: LLM class F420-dependent oxidoreductase [Proteobacteria bacterium]|nr:LLM class F420-dependent oxidoreductase [Pseudomonadota bacterium]